MAALDGIDRLVLLGDVLELRQGPADGALAAAAPVLEALGGAMRAGEVLLVPGNHDHGLIRPWLERRAAVGLEQRVAPAEASPLAAAVAQRLEPAGVELAYPGAWLRPDVYATHGHYLDLHGTVPSFERIGAGVMARVVGGAPGAAARPADYEAVLAPMYAWIEAAAAHARDGRRAAGGGRSAVAWATMAGSGRRPLRSRALAAAFPLAVAGLNRAGIGPLRADLSGPALRRGMLDGMRGALARLGIEAGHVLFGHTHRTGMLPGDDPSEWRAGRVRLHNAGSWIHERRFVGELGPQAPHWPGGALELDAAGPPVLHRLLGGLAPEELSPPRRA